MIEPLARDRAACEFGQQLAERRRRRRTARRCPISEAETDARPVCRTSLRSVSMPVSSSSNRMPNCDDASIIAFCSLACGKQGVLQIRKQRAEQGRPEHQAGDQLPHHRRLLEPQHGFAEQAADQQQQPRSGRRKSASDGPFCRAPRRRVPAHVVTAKQNQSRGAKTLAQVEIWPITSPRRQRTGPVSPHRLDFPGVHYGRATNNTKVTQ